MRRLKYLLILPLFLLYKPSTAQLNGCSTLGQTPSTAFPVCGVDTFSQGSVPTCPGHSIPVPGCNDGITYNDVNPFWYTFTCFASGTLSFIIQPENQGDDYDWQIFDITGHNPDDVYTNDSLFVVGNWAGTYGNTGASLSAAHFIECASDPIAGVPTFSASPHLQQGHVYLLVVSHFSGNDQSGYKLSFGGGTASITDPTDPDMQYADVSCDGGQIHLKLNKKMKCSSLVADGSDFHIGGSTIKIKSVAGIGCSNGFDMDSVVLNLESPLQPGNYQLIAQHGTDSTTLLDNCGREIPVGSSINFVVYGRQPTPLDSIIPVQCAPNVLQLHFDKNIQCNTIASNGSDFSVTGPFPVTISGANGNSCSNGLSKVIDIHLSSPIVRAGKYTIHLKKGSDGTTIIDECGEESIPDSISFSVKDTVSANFTFNVIAGCRSDEIDFFNNGGRSITNWLWTFDTILTSALQNPIIIYNTFGGKSVQLIVTNGFCSDTTVQNFYLDHDSLRASFVGPGYYCPNDLAYFRDTSIGKIIAWNWQFGNGYTSTQQNPPPQSYSTTEKERVFPVRLIVESDKHCYDTTTKYIKAVNNCYIAVPTAFTPNGDGKNDFLYPINAYKAINLEFRVFNKYGQQLFETKDWTHKWDGTLNGTPQATGVYVWMLEYTNIDSGKRVFQKGTTVLIR